MTAPAEPRPIRACPTCRTARGDRAYCAPTRCYCNHRECPAYATTKDMS